jgi:hypothetical protein
MRANRYFWPLAFIILGGLFLLDNLRIIQVNVWGVFIPVLLILGGLSIVFGSLGKARKGETTALAVPLEGSERGRVNIEYGAGKLLVSGGASSGNLLSGSFDGGVDHDARRSSGEVNVKLSGPSDFAGMGWWGWNGGERRWDIHLNNSAPIALDVQVGAAESRIDLTNLRVTDLHLQTGASGTEVWMPSSAGQTTAKISGGVASINIHIPSEVAARIRVESGLSSIDVDKNRFPKSGNDTYQSANYDTASNKVDLRLEMGVGSATIR